MILYAIIWIVTQLYHQKLLISDFINGTLSENSMIIGICNSSFHLDEIRLSQLLECILSQLLYRLIINQHLMLYFERILNGLIHLYSGYIIVIMSTLNCTNYFHLQSSRTEIKLKLVCTRYYKFGSKSCFIVCNSFKVIQHDNNYQYRHNNIMIRNGMSNNVCVWSILFAKFFTFTHITRLTNTMHKRLGTLYLAVLPLVYLLLTACIIVYDAIIDNFDTIMVLTSMLDVAIILKLNMLMSSDVQHNDDCHLVVVKPNSGKMFVNCNKNNNINNNNTITNDSCCTTAVKLVASIESNNILEIICRSKEMIFIIIWMIFINCNLNFIDCSNVVRSFYQLMIHQAHLYNND